MLLFSVLVIVRQITLDTLALNTPNTFLKVNCSWLLRMIIHLTTTENDYLSLTATENDYLFLTTTKNDWLSILDNYKEWLSVLDNHKKMTVSPISLNVISTFPPPPNPKKKPFPNNGSKLFGHPVDIFWWEFVSYCNQCKPLNPTSSVFELI